MPPDKDNAEVLASTDFGYDNRSNADKGVPGLVESREFTHSGDTVIVSGRSTSKVNAVFVMGPMSLSLVEGKRR